MKKVIWTSDLHLGLTTDSIDRTEEIVDILSYIFEYAVKVKADAVVLGGDIFDHNTPNESLIATFIGSLNIIKHIPTYVMVGNHDIIAKSDRKSCLSFIEKLTDGGYPLLRLVDTIESMEVWPGIHFTFLPFVAKSHIRLKNKSLQEHVDRRAKAIQKYDVPKTAHHIVFSHLMPPGCVPGTEDTMLKKVDLMVPSAFHSPSSKYSNPKTSLK